MQCIRKRRKIDNGSKPLGNFILNFRRIDHLSFKVLQLKLLDKEMDGIIGMLIAITVTFYLLVILSGLTCVNVFAMVGV